MSESVKTVSKSHKVSCRLSDKDFALLSGAAEQAGVSNSEAIRIAIQLLAGDLEKLLNSERRLEVEPATRKTLESLTFEIRKVGVNLNQLAKKAHVDGFSPSLERDVEFQQMQLQQLMYDIWKEVI